MGDGTIRVKSVQDRIGILFQNSASTEADAYERNMDMNTRHPLGEQPSCDAMKTHLAQARRKHNHFINLPHLLEEAVDARALQYVEVVPE